MKKMTLAMLGLLAVMPVYAADFNAAPAAPAASAPAPAATPTDAAAPATPGGSVTRAVFTSAVTDREPTDTITSLSNDATTIMFFTELQGLQGQTVTHRWEHGDKVMAEIKFDVGSARWRVFSSKRLDPSWTGEWKVSVIDGSGGTLGASTFTYTAAAKGAADSAPPVAAPAMAPAPAK